MPALTILALTKSVKLIPLTIHFSSSLVASSLAYCSGDVILSPFCPEVPALPAFCPGPLPTFCPGEATLPASVPKYIRPFLIVIAVPSSEIYGTVNKYNKYATQSWNTLKSTIEQTLLDKGYDNKFVAELTADKDFYNKLYLAFNDGALSYGSDQIIEKVVLDYLENGLSQDEIDRISSDIEYSKNQMDKLTLDIKQYQEYERDREEYERWKAQNRR